MIIYTYDPFKDYMIKAGNLVNGVFTKRARPNHYMVLEGGYGIQEDVMEQLEDEGCQTIRLMVKKHVYNIPFKIWKSEGRVANYGHGNQIFLDKKYYEA